MSAVLIALWHALFFSPQSMPFMSSGMVHAAAGGGGFDVGFNFRSTAGFVSDPAGTGHVLGTTDTYPVTNTINGTSVTYGWVQSSGTVAGCDTNGSAGWPGKQDQDNTLGSLAGMNYVVGTVCGAYRMDMPTSGVTKINGAFGNNLGSPGTPTLEIWDDTTKLFTITTGVSSSTSEFFDATGVKRTSASDWNTNQAQKTLTFATTTFYFVMTSATGGAINYLRVSQ